MKCLNNEKENAQVPLSVNSLLLIQGRIIYSYPMKYGRLHQHFEKWTDKI